MNAGEPPGQGVTAGRPLRPFFVLWGGQAFSLLGSQVVQFALIWWLTQVTGSATVLATAALVGLLPQVVLGPVIGALVDRWPRRLILFASDGTVALASLGLALLFLSGLAAIWHVYLILFIRALGSSFHHPAMLATTSLMVPSRHLNRVQGLNQILQGGLSIAAAPLGALSLAWLTMGNILLVDVISAAFAITPLFFIFIPEARGNAEATMGPAGLWGEIRDGFGYAIADRGLLGLIGMATLGNFVLVPTTTLLPLLVSDHFGGGAPQFAFLEVAAGLGILAGGLVLSTWGGFRSRVRTILLGFSGLGLFIGVVGLLPPAFFSAAAVSIFLGAALTPMINGPIVALLQLIIPPVMQGRVFTLLGTAASAMAPIGLLLAGPVADWLGVRFWFVLGGGTCLLLGIVAGFSPGLQALDDTARLAEAKEDEGPLAA